MYHRRSQETLGAHPTPGVEWRTFPVRDLRAKAGEDENTVVFVGYAAVFDSLSVEMWGFQEIIRPGAFAKHLPDADLRAVFNHDENLIMARTKPGTLDAEEDEKGLLTTIRADRRVSYVNDLAIEIERGDVDQMSFAFWVKEQRWTIYDDRDKTDLRELLELDPVDVSPVTWPAYPETQIWIDKRNITDVLRRSHAGDPKARAELRRLVVRSQPEGNEPEPTPDADDVPAGGTSDLATPSLDVRRRILDAAERQLVLRGGGRANETHT